MLPKFVPIPLPTLVERPKKVASTKPKGVKVVPPILMDSEEGGLAMVCWPDPGYPVAVEAALMGAFPSTAGINLTGASPAVLALEPAGTTAVPSPVLRVTGAGLALA